MTQVDFKRNLPIGIQSFPYIRKAGHVYVDKTRLAYNLIKGSGKVFFLSRPRRFGKSLFSSTIGAIFSGHRELFGEIAGMPALAINSLDWDWKTHPVIYIPLNSNDEEGGEEYDALKVLRTELSSELEVNAKKYGLTLHPSNIPSIQFKQLIVDLYYRFDQQGVVVLIDEYDHPLIGSLQNPDMYDQMRKILKNFYGVLKGCDDYLRFVLFTGVSKFSKVGIFSGLKINLFHFVYITIPHFPVTFIGSLRYNSSVKEIVS
jgi:hypothetical protein